MVLQRQDMWFRRYLNYTKLIASRNLFGVPQGSIFVPLIFDYLKDLQTFLKGVFAKNERGYRLNAIKKRF